MFNNASCNLKLFCFLIPVLLVLLKFLQYEIFFLTSSNSGDVSFLYNLPKFASYLYVEDSWEPILEEA